MTTLTRVLRKRLETVVIEARDVSEEAAQKALKALAVADREPHRGMSAQQKALRNRLRAHARQLGDSRNAERGTQEIEHLVAECAYEHWHRMLFARFLAENQLLMEPESDVAIAIEEVRELARSRGKDWVALAGEFAVRMLPQVFRQDDPVLEVQFAPEDRKRLEDLLESLPVDVFTATDSLGWTYQFWQAERKDAINASGDKIGADELPAVTQLFTEDYMVDFLLDNTLGAWHASKIMNANAKIFANAVSEEELRSAVALPGCPWRYLRFLKSDSGMWTPSAGTFQRWPAKAKDLRCMDPCMGSGHFVVAMFERLVALRMEEEHLEEAAAVRAVIEDNLFGLEIDARCTQIAAFNLALAAWRRGGYGPLPGMNLACSGMAPNTKKEDWLKIAGDNEAAKRGMAGLYKLFEDAPVLGSLINPRALEGELLVAGFQDLEPLLEVALAGESADDAHHEMAVAARGIAKAADILAQTFVLVATNVPYLGRGKQNDVLKDYCERFYPHAKADLATCFLERCLAFCGAGGYVALVTPHSWLFLGTYKHLRKKLLDEAEWAAVARLGSGAFGAIGGEVVNVALVELCRASPTNNHKMVALDVSGVPTPAEKATALCSKATTAILQRAQRSNPDFYIQSEQTTQDLPLLIGFADVFQGVGTGDNPRYTFRFWELPVVSNDWQFFQYAPEIDGRCSGMSGVLKWEQGRGALAQIGTARKGLKAYASVGFAISVTGGQKFTPFLGHRFDNTIAVLLARDSTFHVPLGTFLSSQDFKSEVKKLDQALSVTESSFLKVPFDFAHWQTVAAEKYPDGLPKPFSSDLTQWLFDGSPKGADQPLQVAVARVLGYEWPRQTGSSFLDCPAVGPDGLEKLLDDDGIVPLAAIKGEESAAERLHQALAHAYADEWSAIVLEKLLAQVGFGGKSLSDWLRDGFFEQHCALFQQRPFIWHISDGERDGFHALVNYHQLARPDGKGRKVLEKLTYSYLGDWIMRQKAEQKQGKEGADAKLAAAIYLQEELKKILKGEPPYDLFVRWKPLHEQAIGWEPDITDGVRLNIRPFMTAETLKGKSIFRKAPKIKWEKDRGKEPNRAKRDFPWFWSWDEETADFKGGLAFDGNRWNDLHYSNEMKEAALEGAEKKR